MATLLSQSAKQKIFEQITDYRSMKYQVIFEIKDAFLLTRVVKKQLFMNAITLFKKSKRIEKMNLSGTVSLANPKYFCKGMNL